MPSLEDIAAVEIDEGENVPAKDRLAPVSTVKLAFALIVRLPPCGIVVAPEILFTAPAFSTVIPPSGSVILPCETLTSPLNVDLPVTPNTSSPDI